MERASARCRGRACMSKRLGRIVAATETRTGGAMEAAGEDSVFGFETERESPEREEEKD